MSIFILLSVEVMCLYLDPREILPYVNLRYIYNFLILITYIIYTSFLHYYLLCFIKKKSGFLSSGLRFYVLLWLKCGTVLFSPVYHNFQSSQNFINNSPGKRELIKYFFKYREKFRIFLEISQKFLFSSWHCWIILRAPPTASLFCFILFYFIP